jgi:hypothetical protein
MHAFAILVVILGRGAYFKTVIDGTPENSIAFRTSLIRTSARYCVGKRKRAVERDRGIMFADKLRLDVLNRISPAVFAAQKPIFGDDFKVSQERHAWLRF